MHLETVRLLRRAVGAQGPVKTPNGFTGQTDGARKALVGSLNGQFVERASQWRLSVRSLTALLA